ncbi:MAG: hypothetical protein O7D32_10110, partial [bacterium]|nr:hypothetical protein [bacterium]
MRIALLLLVCLSLIPPSTTDAATLLVRQDGTGDFMTIGAAVSAAVAGDSIEVGPGTYPEDNLIETSVTIFSSMGPASTILDGESSHRVLFLRTETFVIEGFTVQNG